MTIPSAAAAAMRRLHEAGFACHAVGGCVRDSLLGLTPHDWDLTTNALPEQMLAVFTSERVIPTGLSHGTVTVLIDDVPLEITTYRTDGEYRDHRRPDSVAFVSDITEDLRRRDFTVNAMAYSPESGLCDPFGGERDLQAGILRCVGNPSERFEEDALRILRGLRFAATYGFTVEEKTAEALFEKAPLQRMVASERLQAELNRLLTGNYAGDVLRRFSAVLYPILPELQAMTGFEQHSRYHDKDVLEHTIAALDSGCPEIEVRLTLLLHDCGKPACFTMDEAGGGHFYAHAAKSEAMAEGILRRLKYDRRTRETVRRLVKYHDVPIDNTDAALRRWLNRLGEQELRWLLAVQEADTKAHAPWVAEERLAHLAALRTRLDAILAEGQCVSLKTLAVCGEDFLQHGVRPGRDLGECLRMLLDEVLCGNLPNERDILLAKGLDYFAK